MGFRKINLLLSDKSQFIRQVIFVLRGDDMEFPTFPSVKTETTQTDIVSIKSIYLHVAKACNLRCSYCYFSARYPLPDEMSTDEFADLCSDMATVCPQKVIFTGGEPLLRTDILDLLYGLRDADSEHRVLRCLNTNGHLVTKELSRKLVGLADEVRVSLDAMPERNDAQRGKGNFDAAMRALEYFRSAGFDPKVLVTVTSINLPDLEELICYLIERNITRINLNYFRPIGRGKGRLDWQVNIKDVVVTLQRAWKRMFPNLQTLSEPPEPGSCSNCGVGSFLNIMPNGDVFPCHVLTDREFRCGNVREQSLVEICRRNGLLDKLAALDFQELAHQDERLVPLTRSGSCMGNVYANTKSLPVWNNNLPIFTGNTNCYSPNELQHCSA